MDDRLRSVESLPSLRLSRKKGPLYRQLADVLREPIAGGAIPIGGELPKEAEIADHYSVSLITVRQALRELEAEGLIRKRSAKPAIVVSRAAPVSLGWTFRNFADMAAFTRHAELRVKSYRKEVAPAFVRHFGMAQDEAGYCLRSLLVVGRQRKAHITTYFPPSIGTRLTKEDFTDALIFQSVQRRLGIRMAVAHCTVRAEVADEQVARDLAIEEGSAILTVEMLYQSADQRNVEFTIARHPADLFSITYDAPNDMA